MIRIFVKVLAQHMGQVPRPLWIKSHDQLEITKNMKTIYPKFKIKINLNKK